MNNFQFGALFFEEELPEVLRDYSGTQWPWPTRRRRAAKQTEIPHPSCGRPVQRDKPAT
jgi:hypothetical protein